MREVRIAFLPVMLLKRDLFAIAKFFVFFKCIFFYVFVMLFFYPNELFAGSESSIYSS